MVSLTLVMVERELPGAGERWTTLHTHGVRRDRRAGVVMHFVMVRI
jgi:hypothetical protein